MDELMDTVLIPTSVGTSYAKVPMCYCGLQGPVVDFHGIVPCDAPFRGRFIVRQMTTAGYLLLIAN